MAGANWADGTVSWADNSYTWASDTGTELTVGNDLTPIVEWSPTTGPGASPVWVDITEYVRSGSIDRGRQSEFDRTSAGKLRLTLLNMDRTFDPEYNSNATVNKRIRVSCTDGAAVGNLIRLFDGWIDAMPQAYVPPNLATVELEATDGFKLLGRFDLDPIYDPVIVADGPKGWWRLSDDTPKSTVLADASGNGYTGRWVGLPSSTEGLLRASSNSAVRFDGENDIGVVERANLATGPLSVECWFRSSKYGLNSATLASQAQIVVGGFSPQPAWHLILDNDTGFAKFRVCVNDTNYNSEGTVDLTDGEPHHLVGTFSSDQKVRLYVDGAAVAAVSSAAGSLTINGSGKIRIGAPAMVKGEGASVGFKNFEGDMGEVALYDYALTPSQVLAHYTAGHLPWSGDSTGDRVSRILDLVGWPASERYIEDGISTLDSAPDSVLGATALDHLMAVEQTEQGRFFISGGGYAAFYSRHHETTLTAEATFTDAQVNDIEFAYDDTNLCNDMTVTREGGLPQRAQTADVIAGTEWRYSESLSGLLTSTDTEALNLAEWRVGNYATPTIRPTGLTFKPMRDLPNQYHAVLDRELGDRISVTRSVPGTDITVDAVIEGISHRFSVDGTWVTSWNLSPLTFGVFGPGGGNGFSYWKLDDPVLSKLDSGNRLGF